MTAALDRAVADVRRAVREELADVSAGAHVLVACSGGADSMALAAATAFEARRAGWIASALVVDHGLQEDSSGVAARVADLLRTLPAFEALDAVDVVRVVVGGAGGPEAAARLARYAALEAAAAQQGIVLLGHTLDDQAETVLMGLVRGSGVRSMAGMPASKGVFRRPLLDVSRADTRRVCRVLGIPVWADPHNDDPRYLRSRVRHQVLPVLEKEMGPGIAAALARTAGLAAADAELLDRLAADLAGQASEVVGERDGEPPTPALRVNVLASAPEALRWRVIRSTALAAGSPAGELFATHVHAVDELVTTWHGQRFVTLPGHVVARRHGTAIVFTRVPHV